MAAHKPEFHILHAPSFLADKDRDGTRSEAFVVLNFEEDGVDRRHEIRR